MVDLCFIFFVNEIILIMKLNECLFILLCDIVVGIVVFFVVLLFCFGIVNVFGVELFVGFVLGIVGGIVVVLLSGLLLFVSGLVVGFVVIVVEGIV